MKFKGIALMNAGMAGILMLGTAVAFAQVDVWVPLTRIQIQQDGQVQLQSGDTAIGSAASGTRIQSGGTAMTADNRGVASVGSNSARNASGSSSGSSPALATQMSAI